MALGENPTLIGTPMSQSWLIAALTLVVSAVAVPALAQAPGADVDARPDPAEIGRAHV